MSQPDTSTEITLHEDESPSAPTLAMIARAASDPNVSVEKMVALQGLHERMVDRAAREAYVRAFDALSMEFPTITKKGAILNNSNQVQSRYAKWEDIHRAILPLLRNYGFVLSFRTGPSDKGAMAVCAVLTHQQGHSEESGFMPLPIDASGAKNNVQGIGSAMSYGKRYTTIAMLNIVTEEDTDGRNISPAVADAGEAERLWVAEAELAAGDGVAAYAEHFRSKPRNVRLYLTGSGEHERIKKLATKADLDKQETKR